MPVRRTPKVEALVVNAIRRLQDVQGSTSREISNYISQEYDVPIEETRRQVQLALRRGLSYGILKRSKRGYYSCNHDYLRQLSLGDGMSDGVMEPCPEQPWRFGVRARKRRKRRARLYARKRRKRLARERARRRRLARERTRKRRGRRPSRRRRRRPRRRRASRGGRPSRRRRGASRRRRRRRRTRTREETNAGRVRTRADSGEMEEMEAKGNDVFKDEDPKSETSIRSVHSDERHSRDSSQNSQSSNTPR
ncbi:hypothetical protein P5V15_013560 [Pogonomyrmex californicus]